MTKDNEGQEPAFPIPHHGVVDQTFKRFEKLADEWLVTSKNSDEWLVTSRNKEDIRHFLAESLAGVLKSIGRNSDRSLAWGKEIDEMLLALKEKLDEK